MPLSASVLVQLGQFPGQAVKVGKRGGLLHSHHPEISSQLDLGLWIDSISLEDIGRHEGAKWILDLSLDREQASLGAHSRMYVGGLYGYM